MSAWAGWTTMIRDIKTWTIQNMFPYVYMQYIYIYIYIYILIFNIYTIVCMYTLRNQSVHWKSHVWHWWWNHRCSSRSILDESKQPNKNAAKPGDTNRLKPDYANLSRLQGKAWQSPQFSKQVCLDLVTFRVLPQPGDVEAVWVWTFQRFFWGWALIILGFDVPSGLEWFPFTLPLMSVLHVPAISPHSQFILPVVGLKYCLRLWRKS